MVKILAFSVKLCHFFLYKTRRNRQDCNTCPSAEYNQIIRSHHESFTKGIWKNPERLFFCTIVKTYI